jgi:hypothetical protein
MSALEKSQAAEKHRCICSGVFRKRVLERREVEKRDFLMESGAAHGFRIPSMAIAYPTVLNGK